MSDVVRTWGGLLFFFALVAAAALTGQAFQPGEWYEGLAKPDFTPPNWIFPVAWTALYILIAIAGWRVWRAPEGRAALGVWIVALGLNAAWSFLMFGQHAIGLALVDIYALLAAIFAFIVLAWKADRPAALLFVPYAAWVSFASVLNLAVWQLNP